MLNNSENVYFTELFQHNLKIPALLSPYGNYVANPVQSELHILNVEKNEFTHKFACDSTVDFIKWSPNSELICCGKLKENLQAWNLMMLHWRCKITGNLSFDNAYWSPDSQNLIVVSEFCIKATVFSLVSSVVTEIDHLKAVENGFSFSPCKKFLIVAQRIKNKDQIGIYSCQTWEALKAFQTETKNLFAISFSPVDLVISVLDSFIEYRVLFYSLDGRLLGKCIIEDGFGLLSVNWCSRKKMIVLGDCWSEVKILNSINYECLTSYQHPDVIETPDIIVYRVKENSPEIKSPSVVTFSSYFELDEVAKCRPLSLSSVVSDGEKEKVKNPLKCGVQVLQCSSDGKYIATVVAHMPKVVFVYSVEKRRLYSIVERTSIIKNICWHPVKPHLIICSSSCSVDIWTPDNCVRYIPALLTDFPITNAAWSAKSDVILLNSKDHFSVVHFESFS